MTPAEQFAAHTATSLANGTFVRLVLSRPAASPTAPLKVFGRFVQLKTGPHLSLTTRYPTRDVTQNLPVARVTGWLREQLAGPFAAALLSTTQRDWQFSAGKPRLVTHKPATTAAPSPAHDRAKSTLLDDSAHDWLAGLGVLRPALADKRRQIERYLEILSHLAKDCPCATIADMGCGKGYLTFALWHLFHRVWQQPVHIVGVEARPELVASANDLARQIQATGLEFVAGTIASVALPAVDALIALHACDTATDDAIRRGIAAGAKLIVVAPCCHKQVRPQLASPEPLAPVLKHGIMAERMAEWATDGLRALHLEAAGYRTKLFEFVASEHTPKNLMIAAIHTGQPAGREQLDRFKQFFGIQHHALD